MTRRPNASTWRPPPTSTPGGRPIPTTSAWRSRRNRPPDRPASDALHGLQVLGDAGEVAVHVRVPGPVRGDGQMGRPELLPALGMGAPPFRVAPAVLGLGLDPEAIHRAPGGGPLGLDDLELLAGGLVGRAERHPTVAQAPAALQRRGRRRA